MANCDFCGNPLSDAQYLLVKDVVYKSCPNCSVDSKQHIHYFCPDAFGTTTKRVTVNNPMGLQSHCAKCRSSKKGPHENAFPCSEVKRSEGYIIKEIRFLPMSQSIFPTYEEVKRFIVEIMPNRGGTYYYMKSKMDCSANTLVLFQYGGELIGYAVHTNTVELDEPLTLADGNEYNGYYQFAPGSITLLNKPITKDEFASIDSSFKAFNQSHQKKVVGLLPAIFELISGKGGFTKSSSFDVGLPEEIDDKDVGTLIEGAKKQVTVNAYERNPYARVACINHYRKKNNGRLKCEVCGFDFGKMYGEEFIEKIHIHHLVEISSVGSEYEINAIEDLIPICPNCHMIAHSKKPPYTSDEIREMIRRNS